jgi:ferredoxin
MKAWIDAAICGSHGDCVAICPTVFDMDDDGITRVLISAPDGVLRAQVLDAAQACPSGAITVEEDAPRSGEFG